MRLRGTVMVFLLCWAAVCLAADKPSSSPAPICSNQGPPACKAPKKDLQTAREAFSQGLKLEQSRNLDEAFAEFEEAARLVPQNVDYLTAREMTRQQAAAAHLQRGNDSLAAGRQAEALAEFHLALNLDPQNEFAQQRMSDALGPLLKRPAGAPELVASADSVAAQPQEGRHDFHYRGDSRGLLTAIASSYGLTVIFDDSFPSRRVHFDLQDADFATAMRTASAVTKTFTVALEETVLFAALDSPENHRLYDSMGLRTFYIPGSGSPQELSELMNGVRSLFDLKFVSLTAASNTITIRGPLSTLEAATQFLESLDSTRPEMLLDVSVYEVDHSYARSIGVHIPSQFTMFNIPAGALALLGGQSIQDLINQLIAGGGINQAGNQSIQALLAQLQSQQGIFSQPFATFGGGLTLMGLTLDQLRATLSLNESSVRTLEHITLRASQQKDATLKIGERYPILNASFAPIFNNAQISQVLQNNSFTAPFPSVSYEDLGLSLKAKPTIAGNLDVNLQLEIQFRSLAGQSLNGVPVISNREYKGGILVKEGEPAVVAGMINHQDQKSLNGLPFLSHVPGLRALTSENAKQEEDDELLLVITPYVIRGREENQSPEIWLGK